MAGPAAGHPPLTPASISASAPWRLAASSFEVRLIAGPPFWQTAEIETAPALVEATLAAMQPAAATPPSSSGTLV